MKTRFWAWLAIGITGVGMASPVFAEDRIQAFVNSKGKVIFTNLVDNTPPGSPELVTNLDPSTPDGIESLINAISAEHGVHPALVKAMIKVESNYNRRAVSSKGALGLMQLIPSTGRKFGVRDFFDPRQNIEGGVRHLKSLLGMFGGNLDLSLAAYNAGENLVQRIRRVPPIPETRDYVRKVRSLYGNAPVSTDPAWQSVRMPAVAEAAPESPRIYRSVDARGVVHFSNIEPHE